MAEEGSNSYVPKFVELVSTNFGYVSSLEAAISLIKEWEKNTGTAYCYRTGRPTFGKNLSASKLNRRISWKGMSKRLYGQSIAFDGIPYMQLGYKTFECHLGKDRKQLIKMQLIAERQQKAAAVGKVKKPPKKMKPSKKINCPAVLKITEIVKFPDFKIDVRTMKNTRQAYSLLKEALQSDNPPEGERRFYIYLPTKEDHKGTHEFGDMSDSNGENLTKAQKRRLRVQARKQAAKLQPDTQSSYEDISESTETDIDYLKEFGLHLNQLRHANTLCDVTITINDKRFPVHKVILCAASPFFNALFTDQNNQTRIEIPDGSSDAFEILLDFAYTGNLQLSAGTVGKIVSLASYMQFDKAMPLCTRYLDNAYERNYITFADAFTILCLARSHNLPSIISSTNRYLARHFVKFSETPQFLEEASVEWVESFFKRNDLEECATEEQILKALVTWLKHDWENRRSYAAMLLEHIKLGVIPVSTLKSIIDTDIGDLPECKEMINEVERRLAEHYVSDVPMSVQYPDQFTSRGTVTALLAIDPLKRTTSYYDKERDGWRVLTKFPKIPFHYQFTHTVQAIQQFEGHRLVAAERQLYLVGGEVSVTHGLIEPCSHLYRYNDADNKWEQLEGMDNERSHPATLYLDRCIYVIGGCRSATNVTYVERYRLDTGIWESLTPMPIGCVFPSAIMHNNMILVYGETKDNKRGQGQPREHLMLYDPRSNRWYKLMSRSVKDLPQTRAFAPILVVHDNKCYIVKHFANRRTSVRQISVSWVNHLPIASWCKPHDENEQEDIAKKAAGAFCIEKCQFISLNGYAHKLNEEAGSLDDFGHLPDINQQEDSGSIRGNPNCVIQFQFDRNKLI